MRTPETTPPPAVTIGLDLGDRWGYGCVVGADGVKCREFRVQMRQAALHKEFSQYKGARVVMEVGLGSPWVSRLLVSLGCAVIVANARRVRLITQSEQKADRRDAEQLGVSVLSLKKHTVR
jgi:transposase